MKKASLFIKGNLIYNKILLGGGNSDLVYYTYPSRYDLSGSEIINGDYDCGSLYVDGIVLITGTAIIEQKGGHNGGA